MGNASGSAAVPMIWHDQMPSESAAAAPSSQRAPVRVRNTRMRRARSSATYDASELTARPSRSISTPGMAEGTSELITNSAAMHPLRAKK